MTYDELEALFLNSNDPIVEQIEESSSFQEAVDLAVGWLEKNTEEEFIPTKYLTKMVEKFRSQ